MADLRVLEQWVVIFGLYLRHNRKNDEDKD